MTDNIADGKTVHPAHTVTYGADSNYLVVAADKGTAAFSDIANHIAAQRGFWLGDAFAAGGTTGYDHKQMGITARGALRPPAHFHRPGSRSCRQSRRTPATAHATGQQLGRLRPEPHF
ncbi:Probable NAD-glutamate dehydrogenase [Mycobacteroides abscessus subsp. abscessus]|nr:Probable NAD-glutamate dehydrogenase [Mycobacteroides abscessus subsp. abscessus]